MSGDVLARLAAAIAARRGADPATSHTARLLARGPEKCAQKFGEEAVEAVIEAVRGDRARLVSEAADALYHLLVMLESRSVTLAEVTDELARREGVSGIAEKAGRKAVEIDRAEGGEALAACRAIRATVFVAEQGVAPERDTDGLDGDCAHYLVRLGGRPVATARVHRLGATAKIQRVAVLAEMRRRSLATQLLGRILDDLRAGGWAAEAVLDAQVEALGLYDRLGFAAEGEAFLDAGLAHRRMRLRLR